MIANEIIKKGRKPKNFLLTLNKSNISNNSINIQQDIILDFNDNLINNSQNIKSEYKIKFINKYKPKNLEEVIGHKENINKLQHWLTDVKKNYNLVILSGIHGIGKTCITELLLKKFNYEYKIINYSLLKQKNIINENIDNKVLINNYFKKKTKYALIINSCNNISLLSEKENLLYLIKNTNYPIILICNLTHSKFLNILKKNALVINLEIPSIDDLTDLILNISKNENINIIDEKIIKSIISFSQFDIRRLINILEDLKYTFGNDLITLEKFQDFYSISYNKNKDIELYSITNLLLNSYESINKSSQYYELDKVLLPLTIYENFYKKIFKQSYSDKKKLFLLSKILNSISLGNHLESNIFSEQNWFLQAIHGFYTCGNVSYLLNISKNKLINLNESELIFSSDLNKTSSKNINKKKNILYIQSLLKNKDLNDILYINKIFFDLNKIKLNLYKNKYNINDKIIKIISKIDKTILNSNN